MSAGVLSKCSALERRVRHSTEQSEQSLTIWCLSHWEDTIVQLENVSACRAWRSVPDINVGRDGDLWPTQSVQLLLLCPLAKIGVLAGHAPRKLLQAITMSTVEAALSEPKCQYILDAHISRPR